MAFGGEEQSEPGKTFWYDWSGVFSRLLRRYAAAGFPAGKGRVVVTPLFLTLLVAESNNAIFTMDSITAVLADTRDHFIVYTYIIFVIMGRGSLY
jgi:tellurite resistance protein TerC